MFVAEVLSVNKNQVNGLRVTGFHTFKHFYDSSSNILILKFTLLGMTSKRAVCKILRNADTSQAYFPANT